MKHIKKVLHPFRRDWWQVVIVYDIFLAFQFLGVLQLYIAGVSKGYVVLKHSVPKFLSAFLDIVWTRRYSTLTWSYYQKKTKITYSLNGNKTHNGYGYVYPYCIIVLYH